MEKQRGYVVISEEGYFFKQKGYTDDINKAKDFNSLATAKKVAKRINGDVREVYYKL